eukprot:7656088-Ditylum_brightwellii.AAC.1
MDKETVDEQVHDASTQGKVVGNDGSPPGEIEEPFLEVEVGQFHNIKYLKYFFKVPPSSFGCPPVPEQK